MTTPDVLPPPPDGFAVAYVMYKCLGCGAFVRIPDLHDCPTYKEKP